MESTRLLRQTVAAFFDVEEGVVDPNFSLKSRADSVSRATLDAAIRKRVGQTSKLVYTAATVGEIEAELFGGSAPASGGPVSSPVAPASSGDAAPVPRAASVLVTCGVDIELVDSMPQANDYWEEPFYKLNFAPSEIAYCLRKNDPRMHFAARWAAKEALKKCDSTYLTRAMNEIEVIVNEAGAPSLVEHRGTSTSPLPHAVSLAHTTQQAIAIVVAAQIPAQKIIAVPQPAIAARATSATPAPKRGSKLGALINLATLIVAIYALYRTYHQS